MFRGDLHADIYGRDELHVHLSRCVVLALGWRCILSSLIAGVSAQLVLASGPDHAPFSVLVDGTPTSDGDTFSTSAACGVAWRSGVLPMGQHSVTGVLRSVPGRYYLELLGIMCATVSVDTCARRFLTLASSYDSGLSLPTQPPSSKTPATSTHHDTSSSAVVGSFSSPSGHISTSTKQAPAPVTTSHQSESSTQTLRESSSLSPSNSPSSPAPPEPPISTRTTSSTSSTNPTSTARQPPMPSRRKAIVVAATVAAAVGIMFFVLAALLLWVWLRRRRHQRALAVRKSRPYPLDLDPPIAHQRDILKHIDLMLEFPSARVLVQGDVKRPLGFDSISRADVNLVATHTQDSVMPRSPPRVLVQAKNGRLGSLTRESSGRTLTAY